MFLAAIIAAALDLPTISWRGLVQRLRLSAPSATACLWAARAPPDSCTEAIGPDLLAVVVASWLALAKERTRQKVAISLPFLGAILVKALRPASCNLLCNPSAFFDPSQFPPRILQPFSAPHDFMGIPLQGKLVDSRLLLPQSCSSAISAEKNSGGVATCCPARNWPFGRHAWIVHGILWSAFHLFMQPTLWDTTPHGHHRLSPILHSPTHKKTPWPGIIAHTVGNLPFFLSLVNGVTSS